MTEISLAEEKKNRDGKGGKHNGEGKNCRGTGERESKALSRGPKNKLYIREGGKW